MRDRFIAWAPTAGSLLMLEHVDEVLSEYQAQGYRLTLRQLFYQLVARDLISNTVKSYDALGKVVSNGRLAGLIDWSMIEDRMREVVENTHWESPRQILDAAAENYYRNRWEGQDWHVEVWCEKDAVSNILEPVCRKWDVPFMACRGYASQSAMYEAYVRMRRYSDAGVGVKIIYLGDHDPSGLDMSRDVRDRMGTFFSRDGVEFDAVHRIALTMEQVRKYHPPENPAKQTDARYAGYASEFGTSSWELDALEPALLGSLVEEAVLGYLDKKRFMAAARLEAEHKALIRRAAEEVEDE